jgi:hypothetical protein
VITVQVISSHKLFINLFTIRLVASYLDLLAKIDVFFLTKNIFTDKSVDSEVMVGIHKPFWLYKYISSQFGKKERKKVI